LFIIACSRSHERVNEDAQPTAGSSDVLDLPSLDPVVDRTTADVDQLGRAADRDDTPTHEIVFAHG
jgi:hypothetical protein